MRYKELKEKIEHYEKDGKILEAFVLQSAYIESLIKLFTEIKFNLSIKEGDQKTINAMEKQIDDYTLFQLIEFSLKAEWLPREKINLVHHYRKKRNTVLHDFVRQISKEDFEKELKEAYYIGRKILSFPEFSASSSFFKLIEQQKSRFVSDVALADFQLVKEESKITDRENEILKLRLEGKTYEEIGGKAGVTRERVRQILNQALSKVKGTFYKLRPVGSVLVNKVTETDIKKIILVMCQTYNISRDDLLGNRRLAELVFPRHVAIYFLRENLKLSFPRIAKIMKKKDHTTIFLSGAQFQDF